ncbi:hypothetical protein BLNAU_4772 [Blattamonas nauphoetae]|uniref:Uncharacterized protein n=1 Tax=Blattamonas nauphoetae TaxID=2049346 RepID=A0ABQ9Y942_9EUKA|nr:hypothetical protein BLNAU_4772 [Blattamonas nauphoetae]
MTAIDGKTDIFSSQGRSDLSSTHSPFSMDCSPFLNWDESLLETVDEQAVILMSLVATVKFKPALDASLEAKAVILLKSVVPDDEESANAILHSYASSSNDYLTNFVQSIVVLISSPSQVVTAAAMKMLGTLILSCSAKIKLALVKADLIPQLIITLNPLSLPLTEGEDIHVHLMTLFRYSLWQTTPDGLTYLEIEDNDEQQAVYEIVLKQVLAPSEKYIRHLCVNRYSIIDRMQSMQFLELIARLLEISPYYQPTMDFFVNLPVILTIPSWLAFFEADRSIWAFLYLMVDAQREWNETRGDVRQMGNTVDRMLRMEGIEDVIEAKLLNDKNRPDGRCIIVYSIRWNNMQGMNVLDQE